MPMLLHRLASAIAARKLPACRWIVSAAVERARHARALCHIVDEDAPGGSAVVAASDAAEALLSSRVPQLQLDILVANLDNAFRSNVSTQLLQSGE